MCYVFVFSKKTLHGSGTKGTAASSKLRAERCEWMKERDDRGGTYNRVIN